MLLHQIISEKLLATPVGTAFGVSNTPFFNILCVNSSPAIFYADFFRHRGANSSIVKDLEVQSGLFFIQIDPPKTVQLPPSGNRGGQTRRKLRDENRGNKPGTHERLPATLPRNFHGIVSRHWATATSISRRKEVRQGEANGKHTILACQILAIHPFNPRNRRAARNAAQRCLGQLNSNHLQFRRRQ